MTIKKSKKYSNHQSERTLIKPLVIGTHNNPDRIWGADDVGPI
jgi:hypothetical protein